ncbi:MAG: L-histidine N(alpha)-methyltransferase [Acidobacteria bacterium]|nr:L-histidine N(alpha)-methyltransferase [Acidobacteriota bacterium]
MSLPVQIDTHIPNDWAQGEMLDDIRRTFTNHPKVLRPKWLYDDRGSELFDRITTLDEYYPTEAERSLLLDKASEIARRSGADTIIELGSGTSDKTRTLLDAFWVTEQLTTFIPVDVSEQTLVDASERLAERYPGLSVQAHVGDFTRHLGHLPHSGRRLVAFLGGTLGNFYQEERAAFLGAVADTLDTDDWILLGVDLVKDAQRLIDAYHDSEGVTAEFVTNVLSIINRELGGNLPLEQFDYVPLWDAQEERVDMRLRAAMPVTARIEALDLDVSFDEGEELRVEISTKFRQEKLSGELSAAGFDVEAFWTSSASEDGLLQDSDFALLLARRA